MELTKTIFGLLVLSSAYAAQDQTYSLVWKPKEGQVVHYKASSEGLLGGSRVTFDDNERVRVSKVERNGDYTTETTDEGGTFSFGGAAQNLSSEANEPDLAKYNVRGERIDAGKREGDHTPYVAACRAIMTFSGPIHPVKIGDTWTKEYPACESPKLPAFKTEFRVAGIDGAGANQLVRVTFKSAEQASKSPTKAEGAFYISPVDGLIVRTEATIDNLKLDENIGLLTARVKIEQKDR